MQAPFPPSRLFDSVVFAMPVSGLQRSLRFHVHDISLFYLLLGWDPVHVGSVPGTRDGVHVPSSSEMGRSSVPIHRSSRGPGSKRTNTCAANTLVLCRPGAITWGTSACLVKHGRTGRAGRRGVPGGDVASTIRSILERSTRRQTRTKTTCGGKLHSIGCLERCTLTVDGSG